MAEELALASTCISLQIMPQPQLSCEYCCEGSSTFVQQENYEATDVCLHPTIQAILLFTLSLAWEFHY